MEAGAELIARARLVCGEQHVITHPALLSTYRSDGARRDGPLPLAAVLPGSVAEVMNVVLACAQAGVAFRVRGAGTSHSGDALPAPGGVLLVLTRMRRILAVTTHEVTAEAGAPVSALIPLGALPWPEAEAPLGTVGGYLAQTGGIANIVALELVRPSGELARLDSRAPGYDLTGAFPGSCGHSGVAVVVTLRRERPA